MALHPSQWKELFTRYREIIMYVIFGALTTLVSIVTYFIIRCIFPNEESVPAFLKWTYRLNFSGGDSSTVLPNIISWIVSVTFAYITNRIWVFQSKVKGVGKNIVQALSFYAARLFTLFVDLIIMFLLVNLPSIENGLYEFCAELCFQQGVCVQEREKAINCIKLKRSQKDCALLFYDKVKRTVQTQQSSFFITCQDCTSS